MLLHGSSFVIRSVTGDDVEAVLDVYRQCEDFLALGPEPRASRHMVLQDIEHSQAMGGVFCGIYDLVGGMTGVVDFVPAGFEGNPSHAFISLLMISPAQRNRRLGTEIVNLLEIEISKDTQVRLILAGVQVNNPAAIRFWQRNGYNVVSGPELQSDGTVAFRLRKEIMTGLSRLEASS